MTVEELIVELRKHDGSRRVVVDGYEGGVDDVTAAKQTEVALNVNPSPDVYGAHETVEGRTAQDVGYRWMDKDTIVVSAVWVGFEESRH